MTVYDMSVNKNTALYRHGRGIFIISDIAFRLQIPLRYTLT